MNGGVYVLALNTCALKAPAYDCMHAPTDISPLRQATLLVAPTCNAFVPGTAVVYAVRIVQVAKQSTNKQVLHVTNVLASHLECHFCAVLNHLLS